MGMVRILIIIILFSLQSAYGQAVKLYLNETQIRTNFVFKDPNTAESAGQFMIDQDGNGTVTWGKGMDTMKVRSDSLVLIFGDFKDSLVVALPAGGGGSGFTDTLGIDGVIALTQDSSSVPYATSDFVFGSPSLDDDGNTNHDTRMFFDKSNGSFRAGTATVNSHWDGRGIGSFAGGVSNVADGDYSVSFGNICKSIGDYTTTSGRLSDADNIYSVAIGGNSAKAQATGHIAIGSTVVGNGNYGVTIGSNITNSSAYETLLGRYSTDYTATSTSAWNASDRLFTVGNGATNGSRSDAITILKNGNTSLGINNFESSDDGQLLQLDGDINLLPMTAPATPTSGFVLYVDSADGDLKAKASTGTITTLAND